VRLLRAANTSAHRACAPSVDIKLLLCRETPSPFERAPDREIGPHFQENRVRFGHDGRCEEGAARCGQNDALAA
jgi:hypothetical protein